MGLRKENVKEMSDLRGLQVMENGEVLKFVEALDNICFCYHHTHLTELV